MFIQNSTLNDFENTLKKTHIDIRLAQRNGKKCITTVEGLNDSYPELKQKDLTLKKLLSIFQKKFSCNGSVKDEEKDGNLIRLSWFLFVF
jgi:translation initiation factor 1